jgi:hypothetical protein
MMELENSAKARRPPVFPVLYTLVNSLAGVAGALLMQKSSLRVLAMRAPQAPAPNDPVLSPARPSLHTPNTALFSCWSRSA